MTLDLVSFSFFFNEILRAFGGRTDGRSPIDRRIDNSFETHSLPHVKGVPVQVYVSRARGGLREKKEYQNAKNELLTETIETA